MMRARDPPLLFDAPPMVGLAPSIGGNGPAAVLFLQLCSETPVRDLARSAPRGSQMGPPQECSFLALTCFVLKDETGAGA